MKTALIAGATGLVGSELLSLLIKSSEYNRVHILVRKKTSFESSKIVEHIIDFDKIDAFHLNESIDHIFCTLGTTIKNAKTKEDFRKVDFDYVLELAKKAKEWKVEKFLVVSSLGANAKSSIFYNRVKGEIENALKELHLPHLFIFRPSLLMGNRKESRPGEKTAIALYKIINPLFIGKLKKYKGIDIRHVARAMEHTAINNSDTFSILESNKIQEF